MCPYSKFRWTPESAETQLPAHVFGGNRAFTLDGHARFLNARSSEAFSALHGERATATCYARR